MTKTTKFYTGADIIADLKAGYFGFETYRGFWSDLKDETVQTSFAHPRSNRRHFAIVRNGQKTENGLIQLTTFIDSLERHGCALNDEDLEDFEQSENWYERNSDNTFNYNGYLSDYVNIETFVNIETEQIVAFFAVGLGLDPRDRYTKYFGMIFDNVYAYEESIAQVFETTTFTVRIGDERYTGTIEVQAIDEMAQCYIRGIDHDFELYGADLSSKEDVADEINEQLQDELEGAIVYPETVEFAVHYDCY